MILDKTDCYLPVSHIRFLYEKTKVQYSVHLSQPLNLLLSRFIQRTLPHLVCLRCILGFCPFVSLKIHTCSIWPLSCSLPTEIVYKFFTCITFCYFLPIRSIYPFSVLCLGFWRFFFFPSFSTSFRLFPCMLIIGYQLPVNNLCRLSSRTCCCVGCYLKTRSS